MNVYRFVAFSTLVGLALIVVGTRALVVADSSALVPPTALVPAFVFGLWIPLAVLLYAIRRRRVAVVALAFSLGLTVNVAFLANAVPANAAADNSSDFYLEGSQQTFACGGTIRDMSQTAPTGGGGFTRPGGAGTAYTWCSDTFTSSQSLNAGTTTANLYFSNTSASKDCAIQGEMFWWHASTSLTDSLQNPNPGTTTIPHATNLITLFTFSWATLGVSNFADGDHLYFTLTYTSSGSNCNNTTLDSDGVSVPSRITTATIVPEGVLGLLLLAPALPFGARWWKRRRP